MATFETRTITERLTDLERRMKAVEPPAPVLSGGAYIEQLEESLGALREQTRKVRERILESVPQAFRMTGLGELVTLLINQRDGWRIRAEAAERAHQITQDLLAQAEGRLAEIEGLGLLSIDGEEIHLGDMVRVERAKTAKYVGRVGYVRWKGTSNGWYHPRGVPLVRIEGDREYRYSRIYVPISDVSKVRDQS